MVVWYGSHQPWRQHCETVVRAPAWPNATVAIGILDVQGTQPDTSTCCNDAARCNIHVWGRFEVTVHESVLRLCYRLCVVASLVSCTAGPQDVYIHGLLAIQ